MPYGIGGALPTWNFDNSANRFVQSYVKDFIDISGSLVLRNNANLYVNGNITVNGNLLLNNTNLQTDLSFNNRIFVGSDMSMNGNVTIANDVSLNGVVLGCTFNGNSIPLNAFSATVTPGGPDYTKASVIYQQKFCADGDVSMNGSTVKVTNMTVNGNIVFNDGTIMNTNYDNKSALLTSSTYDSSLNNTTFLAPIRWMAGSEGGQYLYMVTGSYLNSAGAYNATTNTGAFYRSTTFGDTWTKITIPGSNDYYTGGIDSSITGQYVIVGTHAWTTTTSNIVNSGNDDKFYISSDYGATWAAGVSMNTATSNAISGLRLAAVSMSATGQHISVMPYTQGPINAFSSNYGASFSSKNGAFFELNFVLAGTHMSMSYDGRYLYGGKVGLSRIDLSNNGTQVLIQSGGTNKSGCSLSCSKKSYLMAYFHIDLSNTTDNKVFVCTDGLTPVTRTIPTTSNSKRVYIDYNEHIYVATNNGRCFVSTDTGLTWAELTFGATISNSINYIYVTPKYIFTGEGLQYSAGNGLFLPNTAAYKKYIRLSTFKASTFTGLTVKNTLTAGSYVVSSDYRIKKDIAKLDNRFTVDNLRPVKYLQTLTNKEQYGIIAHELQQYYPELVIGEKDGDDLQRVNYTGLIAILIKEIIQLRLDFAELEQKRQIAI